MEESAPLELSLWGQVKTLLAMIQEHWLGSFVLNLLGYALIIAPAAFFIRRWKNDPQVQSGKKMIDYLPNVCVGKVFRAQHKLRL